MSDLIQLDKAAAAVGKSEVTVRRLIKAGKIPFQKQKTLTGFIYLVDPEKVRAYYQIKSGGIFNKDGEAAKAENLFSEAEEPERSGPDYMPKAPDPVRIAIEDEEGHVAEYWQKRSDLYEDKYHHEVQQHAQTREELGTWRGRAEQAQSMIIKMLPPAETPAIPEGVTLTHSEDSVSWVIVLAWILGTLLISGAAAFYAYIRYFINR